MEDWVPEASVHNRAAVGEAVDDGLSHRDQQRDRLYVCDWCGKKVRWGSKVVPFDGQFVHKRWPEGTSHEVLRRKYEAGKIDARDLGMEPHRCWPSRG